MKTWPLHLILLPVFFIGHLFVQFSGLLDHTEAAIAFLKVTACLVVFFWLLKLVLKSSSKAAVITSLCGILFLFFGDIKQTFSQLPLLKHIAHYKILIPLLFLLFLVAIYKIIRSKGLTRTTLFLNILFLLYIAIDAVKWVSPHQNKIGLVKTDLSLPNRDAPTATENKLPDIYYILLDCYPSTGFQQAVLGAKNNGLDSLLSTKGFYVIKNSRSNYSNTAFTMASTLGMNYFYNIDTVFLMAPYYYNKAMRIVEKAPVFTLLEHYGYRFYNLSNFDFLNHPALSKDLFLSISTTQIIFYNTLWNCLRRDLTWKLFPGLKKKQELEKKKNMKKFFSPQKEYNQKLLDSLSKFPVDSAGKLPFFVYAHLKMPHFPYFFDSTGKPYPDEAIYTDSLITDKSKFANYIVYTNHKVDELVSRLLKKSGGKDIVIIQSDHAIADMDWSRKSDAFRNYSAFYFPDKDYRQLYDSMSNVNTFRVVLNKYFEQQLPLLPDRTYYIR